MARLAMDLTRGTAQFPIAHIQFVSIVIWVKVSVGLGIYSQPLWCGDVAQGRFKEGSALACNWAKTLNCPVPAANVAKAFILHLP